MSLGACVKHSHEIAESVCRSCLQAFCHTCLIYPFGADQPPLCISCALAASGVRKRGAPPKGVAMPRLQAPKPPKAPKQPRQHKGKHSAAPAPTGTRPGFDWNAPLDPPSGMNEWPVPDHPVGAAPTAEGPEKKGRLFRRGGRPATPNVGAVGPLPSTGPIPPPPGAPAAPRSRNSGSYLSEVDALYGDNATAPIPEAADVSLFNLGAAGEPVPNLWSGLDWPSTGTDT